MGRLIGSRRPRLGIRDSRNDGHRRPGMAPRKYGTNYLLTCFYLIALAAACAARSQVAFTRDDAAGTLTVRIGGREAFVFQYGPAVDLPHYWPLRSPSGKN